RQTMNKEQAMLDILAKVKGSAIVYVRNRKRTKTYADLLNKHRIKADFYHAGLMPNERSKKQDEWIKNKTRVICCTNAFGMGIDKPDVRTVVHMDLAESTEAYFQEAGRAGRDEQKAYAVQLYTNNDVLEINEKIADGFPTIDFIKDVYEELAQHLRIAYNEGFERSYEFDLGAVAQSKQMNPAKVVTALKILEQQEILYLTDSAYQQSQVKCICSKESLSRFQEQHTILEPLIKFVLRTSEGVFEDFVSIDEETIASRLKLSLQDTIARLNSLHTYKIFSYQPRKEKPRVTYLQNRVKKEALRLDRDFINKRKLDYENRLKSVKHYITETTTCRTRLLVKYFGESISTNCGICDVCVANKKSNLTSEDFSTLAKAIENELRQSSLSVSDLSKKIARKETDLYPVIDFLLDKGRAAGTADGKIKWL
ncbi:MAG TPA: C-terminal helicase domain-containing protein, partial [Chitinophagales bacterium]|nr:C-terminal helicase domain-containing protein [Chitinophagales bacterium]